MQEDYEEFERLLIENSRKLNDLGKMKLLDAVKEIILKEKYRASISEEDFIHDLKLMEKFF